MSAYVVSERHINAIVTTVRLYEFAPVWLDGIICDVCLEAHAELVVRILHGENIRSVNHCYEDHGALYQGIVFTPYKETALSLYGLHLAIRGLDYQSCETPDWKASFACRLLEAWCREIEKRTNHTPESIVDDWPYQCEETWSIE